MRQTNPRVSIILYAKNEERYLGAMLHSVFDQTFTDFEVVFFDNGSTDRTREIARSFTDPRMRIFESDEDISGPEMDFGRLNNHVCDLARGEFLAMTGADDVWMPDRLALQVAAFDADPLLDVCHGYAKHIDAESNLLPSVFRPNPYHQLNLLRIMYTYLEVAFPTVMLKKSSWEQAGKWSPGYALDFATWLRQATTWRFRVIPEDLIYYRIHDQSASHSPEGALKCSDATIQIRAEARARYSIEDFFPEIAFCPDMDKAKAAAHLELGNMMLGGGCANIQLAFDEYKKADTFWPDHPAIVHNAAVICALDGQRDKAMEMFDTLPDSPMVSASKALTLGLLRGNYVLSDARGICPELYSVPLPAGSWRSDGTVA